MNLLLDSHTLIWWFTDDQRLTRTAQAAISAANNTVFVSAVSAYEIAQKHRLGKLPEVEHLATAFESEIARENFNALPATVREAALAGRMAHDHRDPFDRLLIAQALVNDLILVSNERIFDAFGVSRLW